MSQVATSSYLIQMKAVGIKLLKNKLSEYVKLAAAGETILVTDRDEVVAELGPPRSGRSRKLDDAVLAEAVREGWLTPPLKRASGPPPRNPVMTWEELEKQLEEDRADRWST